MNNAAWHAYCLIRGEHPDGLTADQVAQRLMITQQSACWRIKELRDARLIAPTSQRRRTRSGGLARVLVALAADPAKKDDPP